MQDKQFDLAIVDPPYGLGNKLKPRGGIFNNSFGGMGSENWDIAPDKKYFDELFRVSKNQVIWGGNYFTKYLKPSRHWLLWDKLNPNLSFVVAFTDTFSILTFICFDNNFRISIVSSDIFGDSSIIVVSIFK